MELEILSIKFQDFNRKRLRLMSKLGFANDGIETLAFIACEIVSSIWVCFAKLNIVQTIHFMFNFHDLCDITVFVNLKIRVLTCDCQNPKPKRFVVFLV